MALGSSGKPLFWLAALEAVCMPLQGALNACVYGWSLPSIRDVYRSMLLGTDSGDAMDLTDASAERANRAGGRPAVSPSYSPPDHPDALLPHVEAGWGSAPPHVLQARLGDRIAIGDRPPHGAPGPWGREARAPPAAGGASEPLRASQSDSMLGRSNQY